MDVILNIPLESTKQIFLKSVDSTNTLAQLCLGLKTSHTCKKFYGNIDGDSFWIFLPHSAALNFHFIRVYFQGNLEEYNGKTRVSGKLKVWKGGYIVYSIAAIFFALFSLISFSQKGSTLYVALCILVLLWLGLNVFSDLLREKRRYKELLPEIKKFFLMFQCR